MVAALPTVAPVTVSLDPLPLDSPAGALSGANAVQSPFDAVPLHEAESHELHRHHFFSGHDGLGNAPEDISDADLENDALAQQMAHTILN